MLAPLLAFKFLIYEVIQVFESYDLAFIVYCRFTTL